MTRPVAAWATLIPMLALVVGCSGVANATDPPPTPSPTPTPVVVDPTPPPPQPTDTPSPAPTPSPTATPLPTVPPDPTPVPWETIEIEMVQLSLQSVGLPIKIDDTGDGTDASGAGPRDISPDLDLLRAFAGWADLTHDAFGGGGVFDCDDPHVLCGNRNALQGPFVLIGLQTAGPIDIELVRDGQLAVAFIFPDTTNGATGGGFTGADLILIADLTTHEVFDLSYSPSGPVTGPTPGRVRIEGDTALFVMPLREGEMPRYRVVTFERIPPQVAGNERVDSLPSAPWNVDSFFDITYSIPGFVN